MHKHHLSHVYTPSHCKAYITCHMHDYCTACTVIYAHTLSSDILTLNVHGDINLHLNIDASTDLEHSFNFTNIIGGAGELHCSRSICAWVLSDIIILALHYNSHNIIAKEHKRACALLCTILTMQLQIWEHKLYTIKLLCNTHSHHQWSPQQQDG